MTAKKDSGIQRFNCVCPVKPSMEADPDGTHVRHRDYVQLEIAARDFLEFSQRIERSGDAGAMEEYEAAWHALEALLP